MNLQDAIHQKSFANAHVKAILNTIYTGHWYDKILQEELKPFNISHEQYNILRILRGNQSTPYCLKDIQERMLNKTSNTTRLVEKLRQKALVDRQLSATNRRTVNISITEAGLQLLTTVDRLFAAKEKQLSQAITQAEAAELSRILDKLRTNFLNDSE